MDLTVEESVPRDFMGTLNWLGCW